MGFEPIETLNEEIEAELQEVFWMGTAAAELAALADKLGHAAAKEEERKTILRKATEYLNSKS